jgi:hypothetical protein
MLFNFTAWRAMALAFAASLSLFCAAQSAPEGKWESSRLENGARTLSYSTTTPLLGKPTAVMVNFFCNPLSTKNEKGVLGFDIYIDNVAALKPFRFEDFEGPDAATQGKKLLRISINRSNKPAFVVDSLLNGWTPDLKNFAFGTASESRLAKSNERTILKMLADDAEGVEFVITDPKNAKLKLKVVVPVTGKQAEFKALLAGLK